MDHDMDAYIDAICDQKFGRRTVNAETDLAERLYAMAHNLGLRIEDRQTAEDALAEIERLRSADSAERERCAKAAAIRALPEDDK